VKRHQFEHGAASFFNFVHVEMFRSTGGYNAVSTFGQSTDKGRSMDEVDALIRILVATFLGAMLGLERELTAKPAGLRTHMLVAEGAALFMVGALLIAEQTDTGAFGVIDPTRIGSTIVTGVGFLGAGMILRSGDRVQGLTTAAGIWVAAAIGMLVGSGFFLVGIFGTVVSLATLVGLRVIEKRLLRPRVAAMLNEDEDEDENSEDNR
jgi:putative Mg2+ transporter-C (MgtC) family protein